MTDGQFQTMYGDVSAILTSGGQVKTADTGQIGGSASYPGSNNSAAGYEIRSFGDALDPIVYKIEYGRGGSADSFAIWLTFGTGSDGSGNITGTFLAREQFNGWDATTTVAVELCATDNSFIYITNVASNSFAWINFERSSDKTGTADNRGVFVCTKSSLDAAATSRNGIKSAGSYYSTTSLQAYLPTGNTSGLHSNGNVAIFPCWMCAPGGIVGALRSLAVIFATDVTISNEYPGLSLLGVTRNMRCCNNSGGSFASLSATGVTAIKPLILWE